MIKKPDRKLFSLFFLLLFLGMKSLSYHPLAHTADEDQLSCELCEAVLIQEHTPALSTTETEIPEIEVITVTSLVLLEETDFVSSIIGNYYCRPPPAS